METKSSLYKGINTVNASAVPIIVQIYLISLIITYFNFVQYLDASAYLIDIILTLVSKELC